MRRFFTSESVTEGHPDKVCDRIADGILDELLRLDENSRAAVECCAAYNTLLITGEVTSAAKVDYEKVAREVIRGIGYDFGQFAFDKCKVIELVHGRWAWTIRWKKRRAETTRTRSARAIRA